jgi:hypothetical protein
MRAFYKIDFFHRSPEIDTIRGLYYFISCRSDGFSNQKNILKTNRLDFLPVFHFLYKVNLEQRK